MIQTLKNLPQILSVPLLIISNILGLLISIIVTDEYLLPLIDKLILITNFKSELVAIFLLNLGNGLPDLLSNLILSKIDLIDVIYTVSAGQVTILTLVLGCTIFCTSRREYISSDSFYKNILYLVIGTMFIFGHFIFCKVNEPISLIMIGTYFIFIVHSFLTATPGESIELIRNEPVNKIRKFFERVTRPAKLFFDMVIFLEKNEHIAENNKFDKKNNETVKYQFILKYFFSVMINTFFFFLFNLSWFMENNVSRIKKIIFMGISPFIIFLILTLSHKKIKSIKLTYNLIITIFWLYNSSQIIINTFLEMNLPKPIITLILLPLGNSLGDLITNSMAAQKGLVKTSLIAGMTAPINNILLNMGLTNFLISIRNKKEMDIKKIDFHLMTLPIVFSIIVLFIIPFNYELRNRKLEKELGLLLLIVYVLFVVLIVAQVLWNLKNGSVNVRR